MAWKKKSVSFFCSSMILFGLSFLIKKKNTEYFFLWLCFFLLCALLILFPYFAPSLSPSLYFCSLNDASFCLLNNGNFTAFQNSLFTYYERDLDREKRTKGDRREFVRQKRRNFWKLMKKKMRNIFFFGIFAQYANNTKMCVYVISMMSPDSLLTSFFFKQTSFSLRPKCDQYRFRYSGCTSQNRSLDFLQ